MRQSTFVLACLVLLADSQDELPDWTLSDHTWTSDPCVYGVYTGSDYNFYGGVEYSSEGSEMVVYSANWDENYEGFYGDGYIGMQAYQFCTHLNWIYWTLEVSDVTKQDAYFSKLQTQNAYEALVYYLYDDACDKEVAMALNDASKDPGYQADAIDNTFYFAYYYINAIRAYNEVYGDDALTLADYTCAGLFEIYVQSAYYYSSSSSNLYYFVSPYFYWAVSGYWYYEDELEENGIQLAASSIALVMGASILF